MKTIKVAPSRESRHYGAFLCFLILSLIVPASRAAELGLFEAEADIGRPSRSAPSVFDPAANAYTISGGGENMWFTNDSFHFVYQRLSGDFLMGSDIAWPSSGGNAHRKACLLVRQDLSPDSAYVDVAVHGEGLTSLQFRQSKGAQTREVQANAKAPIRVALERQGNTFVLKLANASGGLEPAGPLIRLSFTDPVYVGLGVCSHDDKALETAKFQNVRLATINSSAEVKPTLHCALEVIAVASKDRRVVHHTISNLIEAPNWTRDGKSLIYNSRGRLYSIPLSGGTPVEIDTGFANRCNNDHGLSPDGKTLAISDQSRGGKSLVYTVPVTGGEPALITQAGPSYWHGWSPDGLTLTYCAERQGEFDIYTIPARGGNETRLTSAKGLDDGPEYSPDGKYIYFNSDRSGTMQIWRMNSDGSDQQQITSDDFNNWFPHPSPDGKWIAMLSYDKNVTGHPANQPVQLRLLPLSGGAIQVLATLFGGQGTINVPSWSPDGKQLAFVSYELLH